VAQNFAADAFLARARTGHHAARRGQNVDSQPAEHSRHGFFDPTYTRQPGRDTRSIVEITGTLPGVYLR
jgi:hypothetical protein